MASPSITPDRICRRIVGVRRGCGKGSDEHGGANQKTGDAEQCSVIGRAGQLIRSPSGRGNGGHSIYYRKMQNRDIQGQESEAAVGAHYDTRLPKLPWSRRIQIPIIAALVYSVIRVLGPTLRFEKDGRSIVDEFLAKKEPCIWAFWHRVIVPISWYARDREIVVMNTTAFDGQWTRKVIERLGFGTAQGSSSRGGLRGLQVMAQRIAEGYDCAFTIDGPRGPDMWPR